MHKLPELATVSTSQCPEWGEAVRISLGVPDGPLPYEINFQVRDLMPVGLLQKPRLLRDELAWRPPSSASIKVLAGPAVRK